MMYLILDGYLLGTGIRDQLTSEFINLETLNFDFELKRRIESWQKDYQTATISNQGLLDDDVFCFLDSQGIELCKLIIKQYPEYKIDYYYSDFMGKKFYPNEW